MASTSRPLRGAKAHMMPATRTVLADQAYESVRALVMDNALDPGSRVGIDSLARDLGVSQTPMREALARLEADGLLTREALRGYSVAPLLNRRQLDELFEFRLRLEPWATGRAAERITSEGRAQLKRELKSRHIVPDGHSYEDYKAAIAHDQRLHQLLFDLAGNTIMAQAFERVHCHLHLYRLCYRSDISTLTADEHRRITSAVIDGHPEAACEAMKDHLKRSRGRLADVLDTGEIVAS